MNHNTEFRIIETEREGFLVERRHDDGSKDYVGGLSDWRGCGSSIFATKAEAEQYIDFTKRQVEFFRKRYQAISNNVEFMIVPYKLGFRVKERNFEDYKWLYVRELEFGSPRIFETEAEAEEYIDSRLKPFKDKLEQREEEERKFAKDHPPRIYP